MAKAQQFVDQSLSTIRQITTSLQQALNAAEKPDNKAYIQSAIDSLNYACNELSCFRD